MIIAIFIAVMGGLILGFLWLLWMDIATASCITSATLTAKSKNGSEE
jgi:hypothetical protein